MVTCGCFDEDQTAEIKETWSSRRGDCGTLLPCDVASSKPFKPLKRNRRPRLKLQNFFSKFMLSLT